MKKILISLTLTTIFFKGYSQETGIKFEKNLSWAQIKLKAEKQNKYIFVDAFATWCAPCRWMDEHVYKIEKVGTYMNENFISVKVQLDSTKEDDLAVKKWYEDAYLIRSTYRISTFPSFIFFNSEGVAVHKFSGAVKDSVFIRVAAEALKPNSQYYTQKQKYLSGKLSYNRMPGLLMKAKYLNETDFASDIASKYITNYLLKLERAALFEKGNLNFLSQNLSTKNKSLYFFMVNKDKINAILGEHMSEYAIRSAISREYITQQERSNAYALAWDKLEKELSLKFGELGQEVVFGERMIAYMNSKDWHNFAKYYQLYFKTALTRPEYMINNLSWTLFENVNDSTVLQFACDKVMKYALEKWYQNDGDGYDTYANLLYKLGRVTDALMWEKRAVKLQPNYLSTLEKMEKGLIILK